MITEMRVRFNACLNKIEITFLSQDGKVEFMSATGIEDGAPKDQIAFHEEMTDLIMDIKETEKERGAAK